MTTTISGAPALIRPSSAFQNGLRSHIAALLLGVTRRTASDVPGRSLGTTLDSKGRPSSDCCCPGLVRVSTDEGRP